MNMFSRGLNKMMVPAIAAGLLLGGISASQAQYFDFTVSGVTPGTMTSTGGGGTATFTETANSNTSGLYGGFPSGTDITVLQYTPIVSTAPDGNPATFSNPYSLDLTLTPSTVGGGALEPGQTHTFTGTYGGSASANASNVTNTFGFSSFTFVFASQTFTITPSLFTAPSPPSSTAITGLQYHVTSSLTATTPEPGAIAMLVGMGVSGSAFLLRRRRA